MLLDCISPLTISQDSRTAWVPACSIGILGNIPFWYFRINTDLSKNPVDALLGESVDDFTEAPERSVSKGFDSVQALPPMLLIPSPIFFGRALAASTMSQNF
nr:hypothetical protein [Bacillus velezensis]